MSCYYLIASLPRLTLDEKKPLSPAVFKALCRAQLSGRDAEAAKRLCDGPDYGADGDAPHPFVAAWQARETQLRNAVARARATRRRRDATGSIRPHTGFDVSIEEEVASAFDQPNPFDRELALDRLRWRVLDELAGTAPFAPSVALAYAVKLRLTRRWAALDTGHAQERLETALNRLPENTANTDS